MAEARARSADQPLRDQRVERPVREAGTVWQGRVWDVRRETVDLGQAGAVTREYVDHPGAVSVLALDEQDRVLLIQQYRHPVRTLAWEIPAGLLDVDGEDPADAARRELAEEADLRAERWSVLADFWSSPGGMNEASRIYLARGLSQVAEEERHVREGEELGMLTRWVPLEQVRDAILAGDLHTPDLVIGVLAATVSRDQDWLTLRATDAPFEIHPRSGG